MPKLPLFYQTIKSTVSQGHNHNYTMNIQRGDSLNVCLLLLTLSFQYQSLVP